jgi:hypothetical protein
MLVVAQDQHRQVLEAIAQREGARAEALMREHSRLAQRNLREAMRTRTWTGCRACGSFVNGNISPGAIAKRHNC